MVSDNTNYNIFRILINNSKCFKMNFHNVFQIDHFGSFLNKIELYEDSFDYILNSLQYSLSNAESMKCLTEEENEKETRFARCW